MVYTKKTTEEEDKKINHARCNILWSLIVHHKGTRKLAEHLDCQRVDMCCRNVGQEDEYHELFLTFEGDKESKKYPFFFARTPYILSDFISDYMHVTWEEK